MNPLKSLKTMEKGVLKKQLKQEGFKHVFEWTDPPHTPYALHAHQDKVSFYLIEGSLDFTIDGQTKHLTKGDRLDVPPGREHSAKVGPEGCQFIVGEMIEGDS